MYVTESDSLTRSELIITTTVPTLGAAIVGGIIGGLCLMITKRCCREAEHNSSSELECKFTIIVLAITLF